MTGIALARVRTTAVDAVQQQTMRKQSKLHRVPLTVHHMPWHQRKVKTRCTVSLPNDSSTVVLLVSVSTCGIADQIMTNRWSSFMPKLAYTNP